MKSKIYKISSLFTVFFASSLLLPVITTLHLLNPVFGQYEGEVIGATITERGEEYEVEAEEGQSVTFYPGCFSVDKIQVTFDNPVVGTFIVNHEDENPTDVKLDRVYEYCTVELEGFSNDDIRSAKFDLKIEKEWMEDNKIKESQIRLLHFNEDKEKWADNDTSKKNENENYVFYQSSTTEFPYLAVAAIKKDWIKTLLIPCICAILAVLLILLLLIISSLSKKRKGKEPQSRRVQTSMVY